MSSRVATAIYRLMERINGERGFKLIPYRIGHKIKWKALKWIK